MSEPMIFRDKNGTVIKSGDTLIRRFVARWRERPGHKRVAENSMGGDVIIPDEGNLKEREPHWVKYHVKWEGACLIADRGECSDFQALMGAELFDDKNQKIHEGSGFHYFNNVFDSTVYEVVANQPLETDGQKDGHRSA